MTHLSSALRSWVVLRIKCNDPQYLSIISRFSTCWLQFCLFYCLVCNFILLHIITYHIILPIKVLYCCASTQHNITQHNTSWYSTPRRSTDQYLTDPSYSEALWAPCQFFLFFCSVSPLESRGWFWISETTGVMTKTNWVLAG